MSSDGIEVIVLYGGRVKKNGTLHSDAADRCRKAVAVARTYHNSVMVFSVNDVIPFLREATIRELGRLQWPMDRLIHRPLANTTLQETRAAIGVLRQLHATSVSVVSSSYHLRRIVAMWRWLGFKGEIESCSSTENDSPWFAYTWEVLGWGKFALQILLGHPETKPLRDQPL